jgi:outer membrane biosynthesis protein TonB
MIKLELTIFSPAEMLATARYLEAMAAVREEEPGPHAIIGGNPVQPKKPAKVKKPAPEPTPEPEPEPTPEPEPEPTPEPEPEPTPPPAPVITVEAVRARMSKLIDSNRLDVIEAALTKFGAINVSGVAPSEYGDFMAELEKI